MAITVTGSPATAVAVYNPIVWTLTSTNYAQTNFKFIADIYLNGSGTPLPRLKLPAVPGANYQAIDIGGIVKNYITRDPYIISQKGFKTNDNSLISIDMQFGEEYGPSSGVVAYPNLTPSSGTVYAANISLSYPDFVTGLLVHYLGSTTKQFLTDAPRTSVGITINNIKTTESYWLYFGNPTQSAAQNHDYLMIEALDASGATINQCALANAYANPVTLVQNHLRVGVGPYDLGLLTTPDLAIGTAPVLPASTVSYRVYLYSASGGNPVTSEKVRFYITSKCSKASTTYRLVWLNADGGYDSFTFYGQQQKTTSVERKMYRKTAGYFNTSNVYTFDNQNSRQNTQFNTVIKDTIKINSDWITEDESTWLETLVSSPDVYYVSGTELIPINIIDNNYTFKTTSRDQLFNLELSFQYSYDRVRQQF